MTSRFKSIRTPFIVFALCIAGLAAPRPLVSGTAGIAPAVPAAPGAVLTVISTSDDGPGSLRQAIESANSSPNAAGNPDRIVFEIPGAGAHSIALRSALPPITDAVLIDGYSQPGSSPNTLDAGSDAVVTIELDGSSSGDAPGLVLTAGDTTIRGLAIRGFTGDGIRITGGGRNRIQGNLIGSAPVPDAPAGNGGHGVAIVDSSGNLIGGTAPAERNEIAGSAKSGVLVAGENSIGNSLLGNRLRANGDKGIELEGEAAPDAGDPDLGPNERQNAPVLDRVLRPGAKQGDPTGATIEGTLDSAPDTSFQLQFFSTRAARADGIVRDGEAAAPSTDLRQGEQLLGTVQVTTGSTGRGSFLLVLPRGVPSGVLLTATATDPAGNTSEFSDAVAAPQVVRTWLSAVSGNWNDTTKWSGGAVPGSTDDAQITVAGTYTVTFNASATVNSLTVGGASGTQTFTLNANTLTLNAASSFGANSILNQGGGIVAGAGSLTVNGTWNWSSGTLNGTGTTTAGGPLNISGAPVKDFNGARTLNTPAMVTWTSTGQIRMGGGAVINNTGTWDCQSTNSIANPFGGTATFTNAGTFRKTTASGTTTSFIPFNNTGTVQAQIGTIVLQGNGTHTGGFDGSGGTIQFNGGIQNLDAGTSLLGTIQQAAGTLNVNSALTAPSFDMIGGTLQGPGTFTVSGPFTWATGLITGAGIFNANGAVTLSGSFTKDLTGARTLNTSNTVTWTGAGNVRMGTGAVIGNTGTWDCQSTNAITNAFGGASLFSNAGTFRKTVAAGTTTLLVPFNNTGSVQAQIGTIILQASGTHAGSFSGSPGTVQFLLGTHDLNAGTSFTGTVQLAGGVLNVTSALTVPSFDQVGGTLQGAGTFSVTGLYTWSTGLITGAGIVNANGGMTLSSSFAKDITVSRTLNTPSTVTWTGSGNVRLGTGAVVNNTGTWDCQSTNAITNAFGGTTLFTNAGTFKKTTATGTTTLLLPFNNTGSVQAQIGTIILQGGGTHTGSFSGSPGTVQFLFGTHDLNAGTTFTGTIQLAGGTLNVNSALTAPSFDQTAGTLSGPATFTVSGPWTWSAGTITGSGVANANGGIALSTTSAKDLTVRTLNSPATATWTAAGPLRMGLGAVLNNTGTWDCQSDAAIVNPFGGAATFTNPGTFKKSAGTGSTSVQVALNNTGTVQAQTGSISLVIGGTHAGAFSGSGGTVQFDGGTHNLNAGTTFAGSIELNVGTLNVNSALTAPTFVQNGGTLQGPGTFTVSGLFTWSAGMVTGAGVINANGGISLTSTASKDLTVRTLNNPSVATWSSTGALRMGVGAVINNTGTWDGQGDAAIVNPFGGAATFSNPGTFRKSGGAGTTTVQVALNNTGTVLAQTGTISLQGGGVHTGTFTGAPGLVEFFLGTHDFNAGTNLTGTAQLAGPATINVNSAVPAATFTQAAGTLQGAGTFTASGLYTWTAGLMTGAGATTANGGMSLSGVNVKDITVRTLNNAGTATWAGTGVIRVGTGAVISNTGTWDCQSDSFFQNPFGGAASFINGATGTFRKSVATGTTTVPISFTTAGTVEVQTGTLVVSSSNYTQTAGITKLTGGALTSTTNINIQGGSLAGTGTVTGHVIVSGTGALAPGLSAGTLSLVGDYTQQGPNGAFNVEIGGLTPGSQHDRVNISGAGSDAALAGILNVSLINAFLPSSGDTFTVMTYPVRTGTLTPNFPSLTGCRSWIVDHGPTTMVLTAVEVPVEMKGLTYLPNKVDLTWASAPPYPGTTYDILRGDLATLPVGPGAGETCLAQGVSATTTADSATPAAGQGFWYLVRERVAGCGTGTYGFTSGGAERLSTGCP